MASQPLHHIRHMTLDTHTPNFFLNYPLETNNFYHHIYFEGYMYRKYGYLNLGHIGWGILDTHTPNPQETRSPYRVHTKILLPHSRTFQGLSQ